MSNEIEEIKAQISFIRRRIMELISLFNLLRSKKIKGIVVHHTATSRDNTTIESVDRHHKGRRFLYSSKGYYVGYHYFIDGKGNITQTKDDDEEGCHTKGYNKNYIGVALTGNFEHEKPSPEQLDSLEELLKKLTIKYQLSFKDIKGHRQLTSTLCPGRSLMAWLEEYKKI